MRLFSRPKKETKPIFCNSQQSLARVLNYLQLNSPNYVCLFQVQAWQVKGRVVGFWVDVDPKIADEVHMLAVLRD